METPTLDQLAWKHGNDKSTRIHGFTRVYEPHLRHFREQPIRLLEIGVGSGGSLHMWRDYFPNAEIFGVDISNDVPRPPNTTVILGDQGDRSFLERLATQLQPLDVIVDDGSHMWGDQITSFECLFPGLKPGGYYFIEDLHTSWWPNYAKGQQTAMAFLHQLTNELNMYGRCGYGMPANDPDYTKLTYESPLCRDVEFIAFYKSIALIHKARLP